MEYGAIDLHTKHSEIRSVTAEGAVVLERRIATRPDQWTMVFGARAPLRILLEAGSESEWVARHLEGLGHEVVVADPNFAPRYGDRQRRVKTDRRDVVALAEANRRGWYRAAHRASADQRRVRETLLVRSALVRMRTQAINVVRGLIRSTGHRVPTGTSETFAARVRTVPLPPALVTTITPVLTVLETLAAPLAAADAAAAQQAAADPTVQLLMTVPGIGPVTALHYRATIDPVARCADAGAVTAYLGLVPREQSSGERRHRGGITKAGPRDTRAMLVQASWTVWRLTQGPTAALSAWAHRLAARRGRKIAIVALARRLARILFAMWRDQTPFVARPRQAAVAA